MMTQFDGTELSSIIGGPEGFAGRIVFAEYHSEGVYAPCFMAGWWNWKYVYIRDYEERLFDLDGDPGEWHNLADDQSCEDTRSRLSRAVFDPEVIEKDVRGSIARRMVIDPAMKKNKTR